MAEDKASFNQPVVTAQCPPTVTVRNFRAVNADLNNVNVDSPMKKEFKTTQIWQKEDPDYIKKFDIDNTEISYDLKRCRYSYKMDEKPTRSPKQNNRSVLRSI